MVSANDFVNKLVESVGKKKFADYIKASPEEVAESLRGKHIFVSGEFATEKPGPGQSKGITDAIVDALREIGGRRAVRFTF